MAARLNARNGAMAVLGLAVGGLFLWLAMRHINPVELREAAAALDPATLGFAAALYWLAMGLRVLRWQVLLRELAPAPLRQVAETLIVGYAVNNLLPARLGEVARAAYAKHRLEIGRARVFGSIVVERLLDLVAILLCLAVGLAWQRTGADATRLPTFELIALNAGAVIGLAALGVAMLRSGTLGRLPVPAQALVIFDDFRAGLGTLNARSAVLAGILTAGVWVFEVMALARAFAACGVTLSGGQALLVMGAASLSTLVPTAPGYLGTYQLVAVLALTAFNLNPTGGIVASTTIQVALFGSVTVAGGLLLALRAMARLRGSSLSTKTA